jgi:class 3 adenylate cyclase
MTVDDLPDEVKGILYGEAHRGQRNTFVIRLCFALFGILSALAVAGSNSPITTRIGIGAGVALMLFAVLGLLLSRRPAYPFWFKYAGVTVDATVVSLVSISSLYNASGAYEALLFPTTPVLYMMFNMLTALQFSVRLSVFAAFMAGMQRALLFGYCVAQKLVVLSPESVYGVRALGTDDQVMTILFIVVSGIIAAWVSHTARRLLLQSAEATVRKRKLEQTQDVYRRYLSPHVRDYAIRHPESMTMGGVRRVAVVLTTEIRDFNRLVDQIAPEEAVEILNAHYASLVEIVFRHGGTLDKFTSAGVSAIFGIPHELPDAAGAAVRAAYEMHEAVAGWNRSRAGKTPALRLGIAIAEGLVVAGNIGSSERMEYTVIGKAANLSARLRGLCLGMNADILINAAVHDAIRGLYRAERIPQEMTDAMDLDSAVYRLDVAEGLVASSSASGMHAGALTVSDKR